MENTLELIESKIRKYKLLKTFNIFLASIFSLIGTISIVGLLMILNTLFGVGYFTCFVLTFVLSQIYSVVINEFLFKKIENKMNDILSEINRMKVECECNICLVSKQINNNIASRYENLSLESKLELLTYIKDGINSEDGDSLITSLNEEQNKDFKPIPFKKGYSRRRNIENERDKQNYS